jgi:cytochrome P450
MTKTTIMNTKNELHEPPLIPGLPFFGNIFAFRRDPLKVLDEGWKDAGDLYQLELGPRTVWVISDPELVQNLFIEQKHIFQRPRMVHGGTVLSYLLGQSVLTIDGEEWLFKRRLMQPIFHRQRIHQMGQTMVQAGEDMLGRWDDYPEGKPVDLSEEMKVVTLDIINRTMFSTNVLAEIDQIGPIVDIGLHYIANRTRSMIQIPENWPTPANLRFNRARDRLDQFLYGIIRERRQSDEHPGDLLDMLLAARDEESGDYMTDEQVRNEVATVYGAGHETTAVALTWTWYALNQNPDVLARLQNEVDSVLKGRSPEVGDLPELPYTQAVFQETLRLYPPVPITIRVAFADTKLGEYAVPKGMVVSVVINNIHRHPDYWDKPERYLPERFLPENSDQIPHDAYIPFLTGPHLCIGNNFALTEGPLLLATMVQKYNIVLVPDQEIIRDVAVTMRPKGGMQVRLEKRDFRPIEMPETTHQAEPTHPQTV